MAKSSNASVPGWIGTHSLARAAVWVRRGSMTTTRPRLVIAASRPMMSGAESIEPCEAAGLAPSIIR